MNGCKYEDMSLQINNKGNNLLLGHITQEKEYKAFMVVKLYVLQ